MTRILFIGASLSANFGGPSIVSSTVKTLNRFIPEAEFTLLSSTRDYSLSKAYGVKIVPNKQYFYPLILLVIFLKKFGLDISPLLRAHAVYKVWNAYESTDIIIDIWGIIFTDTFIKTFPSALFSGIHLLVGKLLNKPVIKYTTDAGPLKNRWNRSFAKFYLNKIDLIFARGEITKKLLIDLGVTTPIRVYPDTAFLLDWIPNTRINKIIDEEKRNKLIVGMSVSFQVEKAEEYKDQYIVTMAQTISYLIKDLNIFVILIPNDINPNIHNDIDVAKQIFERVSEKERVMLLIEEYSAMELKGIISKCDLLIAARYHSIVAGISMGIPTLAISWHHKYFQVLKLVGQEEYICDIKKLNFNELQAKINKLYKNRKKIKSEIRGKLDLIMKTILEGGKITAYVLAYYYNALPQKHER